MDQTVIYDGDGAAWFGKYKYRRNEYGYYARGTGGNSSFLHRDIYTLHNGAIPTGHVIHHIDGDKENNTPSNLETMTASLHQSLHIKEVMSVKVPQTCAYCGTEFMGIKRTGCLRFCKNSHNTMYYQKKKKGLI
jgi:hypothetical protein